VKLQWFEHLPAQKQAFQHSQLYQIKQHLKQNQQELLRFETIYKVELLQQRRPMAIVLYCLFKYAFAPS
jgi:hypothetical protein